MATSTISNYTTIPSPPAASIFAELRYGTNGSEGGQPECLLGHSGTDASSGRIVWDDTDDAFDSGEVAFSLVISAGGGAANPDSLTVVGLTPEPISYGLTAYGPISAVQVAAGVQINAASSIVGLVVQFYRAGVLQDSFDAESHPAVDTTSSSNSVAAQVVTVTPTSSNNDEVHISGSVHITAPAGTFPDVNDMFAQIFIQTGSGNGGGMHPIKVPVTPIGNQ